ncbi:fimbrial protein [Dyella nitratireducens]|uniref:Ferrous iron transporter B n=1 Tax=Dyella nitratireducens TaxID=1849580 RepID=A0ABQ1G0Z2_9GAMM|nr:fimbrial protein [Dyella nitratireducens]GGA34562.1 ferrous iron transporter B [Dyella nitratireducens]GLQ40883.1 ferrous iron transporter B [Dyella nitratireducens]
MNTISESTRSYPLWRKTLTGWLVCGVLTLGSSLAFAQSTDNAQIDVTGSITGGACTISTPSVFLGDHNPVEFKGVGTFTDWVDFPITSGGCTPDIVTLYMGFDGTADVDDANVFAVASGGATGLGIQLQGLDAAQTIVIPNSTTQLVTWVPVAAGGTYPMRARYWQTKATVTSGPANGTVTVMLSYN